MECKESKIIDANFDEELDSEAPKENKGNVLLEKPISCKDEDKFNIYPYVLQLKEACNRGAIFVAVDGKFGSGKSSVVNLYESEIKDDSNIFVNINFMNINSTGENIINDYHRYFVNQVTNDICKNPYEFEKLFYNQRFSYTTMNLKKNIKYKKLIDRILLWLIGFISIYTIYGSLLDNEDSLYHIAFEGATKIFPLTLLITFVLLVLYGYGFYKPDKSEQSPMLDTDKCRNNFLKVINDYIPENSTLYLIIDDLDRVKSTDLQLKIISLLFNEYYSLNNLINNISLKFIFMIDIDKIDNDDELQPKKMFDYILPVSSNQKTILKHYIGKMIQENDELTEIFNIENSEYFIGLMISHFKEMREIKHLLNKILTKSIYINNKNVPFDSKQLIILCILTSIDNDNNVASSIEYVINKVGENKVSDAILEIIKENVHSKVIDKNYYIYIYNFIDESNLLSLAEESVSDIIINTEYNYLTSEKINTVNEYLESKEIRLNYIYDECYKYVGTYKKIILLGNKKFYNYMKSRSLIDKSILFDSCLNNHIYNFYNNFRKDTDSVDRANIIHSLNEKYELYNNGNIEVYDDFISDFQRFIKNLKEYILDFNINDIFFVIEINDDIFNLLNTIKKGNHSIIYDLIAQDILSLDKIKDRINKDFIDKIKLDTTELFYIIGEKILKISISLDIKLYIIINQSNKYENIDDIFNEFIEDESFTIETNDIKKILEKYGYNSLLDKYINLSLDNKVTQSDMMDFIKSHDFSLTNQVLDKIKGLRIRYSYSDFYENLFKEREQYDLLIYSQASNCNKFKLDTALANLEPYTNAVFAVYKNMGNDFKKEIFTLGFTNKIVNEMDFSSINYTVSDFWKIDILIPSCNTYDKCVKIFDRLRANNKIIDYSVYYKNNKNLKEIDFIEKLGLYASEMTPSTKGNITKAIRKVRERRR